MKSELFEETLRQHKDGLTDELEQLGKHRQAQLVAWDIEQNESDYEFYFNAAWQEQQAKIDELQNRINEALEDLEYPTAPWGETIALVVKVLRGASD